MPIKLFFTEFSHTKYMKWGGLYLLGLYDGIILLTQHPKNHCIENQSGATAFLSLKLLGLKELLTQGFPNWHRSTWEKKYNQISKFYQRLTKLAHSENKKVEQNLKLFADNISHKRNT